MNKIINIDETQLADDNLKRLSMDIVGSANFPDKHQVKLHRFLHIEKAKLLQALGEVLVRGGSIAISAWGEDRKTHAVTLDCLSLEESDILKLSISQLYAFHFNSARILEIYAQRFLEPEQVSQIESKTGL